MVHETPVSLAIKLRYEKENLKDIWNERRINRLCGFLRINQTELSALIGITPQTFMNQLSRRDIHLSGCILLTLMEDFLIGDYVEDTIPNLLSGAIKNGKLRNIS